MGKLLITLKSEEVKKDYYVERKLEVKEPMVCAEEREGGRDREERGGGLTHLIAHAG